MSAKLKDGTPIDLEFLAETVANNERSLWELLNTVVRALPHTREQIEWNIREHNRVHNDLCNELRARVAKATGSAAQQAPGGAA